MSSQSLQIARQYIGQQFGRLTVVEYIPGRRVSGVRIFPRARCTCICGNIITTTISLLVHGHTQSCGCLQKELAAEKARILKTTHGMFGTPEYKSYGSMKDRCSDSTNVNYGGRGISICKRWMKFENFFKDMGFKPSPKLTLERIDNSGNYSCGKCEECIANGWPANVIWAPMKDQARNKRSNHLLTFENKTQCVTDWAQEKNIPKNTLYARLYSGWSTEAALTTPVRHRQRNSPQH